MIVAHPSVSVWTEKGYRQRRKGKEEQSIDHLKAKSGSTGSFFLPFSR
jgi:hypothetical protein